MTLNFKKLNIVPWWVWILSVDVVLILVTSFHYKQESLVQGWRLLSAFDLGREMNAAVWWSAILQVSLGLICYEIYVKSEKHISIPWLLLSLLFNILAFDEIASIHERIPHLLIYALYMPLIFILANSAIFLMYRKKETRKTAVLIFIGFCFYGSVFIQELIEHRVNFPFWFKGYRLAIEEGCELLGTFVIMYAVLARRYDSQYKKSFILSLPNSRLGMPFSYFLWGGMAVQILICLFIIPGLDDLKDRGNPGAFYPVLINFFLFCNLFWRSKEKNTEHSLFYKTLSFIFLISSVGSMYSFTVLVPSFSSSGIVGNFQILYIFQLIMVFSFTRVTRVPYLISDYIKFGLLLIILILSFYVEVVAMAYLLLGGFAFVMGQLFTSRYSIKS